MPTDGEGMEGRDTDGRLVSPRPRLKRISITHEVMVAGVRLKIEATPLNPSRAQLNDLLDKWRNRASIAHATDSLVADREERIYMRCAQELQEVLDAS